MKKIMCAANERQVITKTEAGDNSPTEYSYELVHTVIGRKDPKELFESAIQGALENGVITDVTALCPPSEQGVENIRKSIEEHLRDPKENTELQVSVSVRSGGDLEYSIAWMLKDNS